MSASKCCDCQARVNDHLRAYNTELMADLLGPYRAFVETTKADQKKRGKPMAMIATYCPFCGSKYPKRKNIFQPATPAADKQ